MTADHEARQRGRDLAHIRCHWVEAYAVGWENGTFCATRRDNGAILRGSTAAELHVEIRADFSATPVPREVMERSST